MSEKSLAEIHGADPDGLRYLHDHGFGTHVEEVIRSAPPHARNLAARDAIPILMAGVAGMEYERTGQFGGPVIEVFAGVLRRNPDLLPHLRAGMEKAPNPKGREIGLLFLDRCAQVAGQQ